MMKMKSQNRPTPGLAGTGIIALLLLLAGAAQAAVAETLPGIPEFIDEMVAKHRFNRTELEKVFERARHLPAVIEAISRPATARPWQDYRASFVNPERIGLGLKFWEKHQAALQNAEREFGVPQEIILAVIGVETVYGKDQGRFRTLDALTTLAFDYPRRSVFFRSELENYLLLARDQQLDLLSIRGSYAGALGIPQFMPSSYRNHAVDFNNDERIDLLSDAKDAIGSVANYLKNYGWDAGKPRKGDRLPGEGGSSSIQPIAVPALVGEKDKVGQPAEKEGAEQLAAARTLSAWASSGVVSGEGIAQDQTARLVDFTLPEGKEFWLVFNNFDVITRYNNSDYYAMSVFQLAQAIKAEREAKAAR